MKDRSNSTGRGLLHSAWRAISSMRLALWLLLGVLLSMALATLIPQMPRDLQQAARAEWMALAARRLGGLSAALSSCGLLDVYHSPAFVVLVSILLLNTAACTLDRARSLARRAGQGRMDALGSLITHIAVIAIVLSIAASHSTSWQHTTAPVAEGQTYVIQQRPGWSVRNDGLSILANDEQQMVGYRARVSLLENGQTRHKGEIRPNAPLRLARTGVWLMSYEPGVTVQVQDTQNQPLLVQHAEGGSAVGPVTASLSDGATVFDVPAAAVELLLSAPQAWLPSGMFDLTVRSVSTGEILLSEPVLSGVDVEVGAIVVSLETSAYAIYRLKYDPAAVAVLIAALALLGGTSLSVFAPREPAE